MRLKLLFWRSAALASGAAYALVLLDGCPLLLRVLAFWCLTMLVVIWGALSTDRQEDENGT